MAGLLVRIRNRVRQFRRQLLLRQRLDRLLRAQLALAQQAFAFVERLRAIGIFILLRHQRPHLVLDQLNQLRIQFLLLHKTILSARIGLSFCPARRF